MLVAELSPLVRGPPLPIAVADNQAAAARAQEAVTLYGLERRDEAVRIAKQVALLPKTNLLPKTSLLPKTPPTAGLLVYC